MGHPEVWSSIDVAPDPSDPGRWHASIDDIWVAWTVPLGGTSAAVAAQAMTAALHAAHPSASGQALRSLHCLFAAPVPAGPVEADVTVLRAGRTQSQVQVDLHGPGEPVGLSAVAAFGAPRPGYRFTGTQPPAVPPPEECPSFRDPPPPEAGWDDEDDGSPLWEALIEGRAAMGLPPWDPTPRTAAHAESAAWYRFDVAPPLADGPDDAAGAADDGEVRLRDFRSVIVLSDLMLGSVNHRIGMPESQWFGPSVDLTVHLRARPRPGWILSHNRAHVADDGYASIETTLWGPGARDGELELAAFATQQMYFLFPDGPPPPEARILD